MSFLALALVLAQDAARPASDPRPPEYDPLELPADARPETVDLALTDDERPLAVLFHLPARPERSPVVLFSHGLGGSRQGNAYLGEHWAARGYVAVFLQHPGSDDSIWKDLPAPQRMAALRAAANPENLTLRVRDVGAVLDGLERWNAEEGHVLFGRLDLEHVGMSGHSFGAVTTQSVGGQEGALGSNADERIDAALCLSPSPPRLGDSARAFASVRIPWMLMTGTLDSSPIVGLAASARLEVFPHLPAAIDRYELVLSGAEHSAFGDRPLIGGHARRNPNHHRAILALSTAFWDAHLRGDPAARAWLFGSGAWSVLEEEDRWQCAAGEGGGK